MKEIVPMNNIGGLGQIGGVQPVNLDNTAKDEYKDSNVMLCGTWGTEALFALSNNGGSSFSEKKLAGSQNSTACLSANGKYGIIASKSTGLMHRKVGNSFELVFNSISAQDARISEDGKYIICATDTGIYHSTDYGKTFKNYYSNRSCRTCCISSSGQYMAVFESYNASAMYMYFSNNFGNTWVQRTQPNYVTTCECSPAGTEVYSGYSDNVSCYKYTNNGATATAIASTNGVNSTVFPSFSTVGNFVAIAGYGSSGAIRISTNNGASFFIPTNGVGTFWCCKFSGDGKKLFAFKNTGYIYYGSSADNFATLAQGTGSIYTRFMDVSYDGNIIMAGDDTNQNIKISYDAGVTFNNVGNSRAWGRVCMNTKRELVL